MTHFINGKWQTGKGRSFESTDPISNKVLWQGNEATDTETEQAVHAARKAYPVWHQLGVEARLNYLHAFNHELIQNKQDLAETISQETGKPLWESLTEVAAMINKLDISVTAYHARTGEVEHPFTGAVSITRHKPHGVIAVYGPFNFPCHLANGHIIPALLAGNTIVLKPSELTPLTSQKVFQLWEKAGLPEGVINLIQGGRATGETLLKQDIDGLFFTGSYKTGKLLHQQLAGCVEKLLVLELGGNNPLVIHEVGDPKAAAYHTALSAFLTAGQRCTCARRLILPEGNEGDSILEALITLTEKLSVGRYDQSPEPFMGSLITQDAANKVLQQQSQLQKQGANILLEAKTLIENTALITPSIIDVTNLTIPDEETFGPMLQVIRARNFEHAIEIANNTSYGLSAGLFSDNADHYQNFYQNIRAGLVNWNRQLTGASSHAPFGGVGHSGNHHPSAYYAADYCAYPVASLENNTLDIPEKLMPGIALP